MRKVLTYVENNAGMAFDHWSAAWVFDVDLWGYCGQGPEEESALTQLRHQITTALGTGDIELAVAERVSAANTGEESAFARDRQPCTDAERQSTLAVLDEVRPQTVALVRSCPSAVLDWDDPDRVLPSYAAWRTIRQLARHIVDTESRYYLPCVGLGYRAPANDLLDELRESAAHVRSAVETMRPDILRTETVHGTWTSVKVLRRLAWHERGELAVMRRLADRARTFT